MANSKGRWWHWRTGDNRARGMVWATSKKSALRHARQATHRRVTLKCEPEWEHERRPIRHLSYETQRWRAQAAPEVK